MTDPYPVGAEPADRMSADGTQSLGTLMTEISRDLSTLLRQEVELAKVEVKEEVAKAGKGAGLLGAAGFAGYMLIVLLSFAAAFGIGSQLGLGWGTLIVAGVWAVIGAVLFLLGRARLRRVSPKPERTIQTLKEDAQWARHPTS
jgi:putative superfamily III holin-X